MAKVANFLALLLCECVWVCRPVRG
jgi:hypothetical protein